MLWGRKLCSPCTVKNWKAEKKWINSSTYMICYNSIKRQTHFKSICSCISLTIITTNWESTVKHCIHIKDNKYKSTSPWCNLRKSKAAFQFSIFLPVPSVLSSLLYESEYMPAWMLSSLTCLCCVPNKGILLCIYWSV